MIDRPAAPPAPAAPKAVASPKATIPSVVGLEIQSGPLVVPERIVIYGPGGIGKTTLAAYLPAPLFLDVEKGSGHINVSRDNTIDDWITLRGKAAAIAANPPDGVRTIVIDSGTKAEELDRDHVVATRKTESGHNVDSIEGFGWGKGWQFVAEEYNALLADLDRITAKGLHVCLIAHDVSSPVPNPAGEDFIRWEPHLYAGDKKGRGSIRERVKQWADHLLFVGYDVHVKEGKGIGSGTRSIYTYELPTHIAKSRTKAVMLNFDPADSGAIWRELNIT